MKKAAHMLTNITMDQLIAFQEEYTALARDTQTTAEVLDRIGILEIIFQKIDMGKITISGSRI